jgi:SAM-dependent methyltransferase
MSFGIDRFSVLAGVVVVRGWSSDYAPGREVILKHDGRDMQTITRPDDRLDIAAVHGPQAAGWGFRAYGVLDDVLAPAGRIGLRWPSGAAIEALSMANPPQYDNPHALIDGFFAEVNATGGTVLEIGSRARSGNSFRDRFGAHVRYIGADITAGENVDVVVDAHHLADAIGGPVDYVFSVSTFEHFLMPWKVVLEINKVLRLGGKVLSHSHQSWPSHEEPWDYFRFSREAWGGLFNRHTGFRICESRRGEAVSILSLHNPGGPFDGMDAHPGYALTVALAEKVAPPQVAWEARMSDIQHIEYKY